MKPDCFGNFTPMIPSPCARCAQRGPCASRTTTEDGFLFMPIPRYADVSAVEEVKIPDLNTYKMMEDVLIECSKDFVVEVPWVHIGARRRLIRVMALAGPIGVQFKGVPPSRLAQLPSAGNFDIRPLVEPVPKHVTALSDIRRHLRIGGKGSVALTSRASDAVALIREAAVDVYGDLRD